MPKNRKVTAVIKGRSVLSATHKRGALIIVFDDRSRMTVKTVAPAAPIPTAARIKAVLEDDKQCALQFDDGSLLTIQLADPGASVSVRDRNGAVEYLG
jgi:hypothetical protein